MTAHHLDCRGMQCPTPLVEMCKLARTLSDGDVIEVVATDEAFPVTVAEWCRMTGNDLQELTKEDDGFRARIAVLAG